MNPRQLLILSKPYALLCAALLLGFSAGIPVGGYLALTTLREHGREIGSLMIEHGVWLASATSPEAAQWDVHVRGAEIFSADFEASLMNAQPIASSEKPPEKKAKGREKS